MTYYAPDHFGSKAAILINFYSNASDRGTQMRNIDDYFGRADYCIPFLVSRSSAVNVMQQATPEMNLGAGYSVTGEYIRPDRDIWVVTIDPVEEAIKQLMDPSPGARAQAARSLRELATKADNRAVAALLPRLGAERDMAVKAAVAGALGEVVQRGDNRACLALQRCLEALNIASHVREAAALALGKVAEKGDRGTVDALARCLDSDSEPTVRASAAYALGRVADKDDVRAIEALSYRFGDEEEDEKVSAVAGQALKRMGMDVDDREEGGNCVLT